MTMSYALYFCGRVVLQNLQRAKYKIILGTVIPNVGLTPFLKSYQNFRNCRKAKEIPIVISFSISFYNISMYFSSAFKMLFGVSIQGFSVHCLYLSHAHYGDI